MERIMETTVLVLGLAMVAPLPFEEIIGGYGRLALAVLGFLLIFWWLFRNDHKKDLKERGVGPETSSRHREGAVGGARERASEAREVA
jgi:hypothetical protein